MRTVSLALGLGLGLFLAGCAADADPAPESPAPVTDAPSTTKKPAASTTTDATENGDAAGETTDPTTTPTGPTKPASVVAWYKDGLTTGTGSANDLAALKVDASTVTVAQLATLMETSKYNGEARPKDKPADFDEVFLSRAQNGTFMTKLGKAVAKVVADGYPQVIVYSNGPRCIAQAPKGSWLGIAKAGAMIGLESYTTTLTADINAAAKEHPFQDVADLDASIAANSALFAAWETRVRTYITDTKAQLGNDESLNDHITLLEYENMKHDIDALENGGMSATKAEHFASLWYAAMKSAAAKEGVHWGIWHPA